MPINPNQVVKSAVVFLFAFIVFSCGGPSDKQTAEEAEAAQFAAAQEKIVADIARIAAELPPPSEIPNQIRSIGAKYHPEIVNSLDKLESYRVDDDKAALNLGIYASDIAYLVTYDLVEDSEEHILACQELAQALGVSTAFDTDLIAEYEAAMNNVDSLNALMNRTIKLAEDRLEHADRLTMSALVLTGSFLESLFIAVEVVKMYPENTMTEEKRNQLLEPLVQLVLDQKHTLKDVIVMLQDIPQDDTIARMIVELRILEQLYDTDLHEIAEKMKSRPEGFVVSADMLLDINIEIIRIREEIVS